MKHVNLYFKIRTKKCSWKSKIMPLKVFYGDDCISFEEAIAYAL